MLHALDLQLLSLC